MTRDKEWDQDECLCVGVAGDRIWHLPMDVESDRDCVLGVESLGFGHRFARVRIGYGLYLLREVQILNALSESD